MHDDHFVWPGDKAAQSFFDRLSQGIRRFRDFISRQKEHLSIWAGSAEAPMETICFQRFFRYLPRSFMAKTSWVNRNERKRSTVKTYAALRAELKAKKDYAGLA